MDATNSGSFRESGYQRRRYGGLYDGRIAALEGWDEFELGKGFELRVKITLFIVHNILDLGLSPCSEMRHKIVAGLFCFVFLFALGLLWKGILS